MYNRKYSLIFLSAFTFIVGAFSVSRTIVLTAQASVPAPAVVPAMPQATVQIAPLAAAAQKSLVIENPVHLSIPNVHVDAHIIPVGVTKTNNLDVPPNFVEVGWYEYGAKPGEVGNAVLDGHVDNGGSVDGVFKHLRDLKPGDDVYVTGADGAQLHFKVMASDVYLTKQFPSDLVFNQNDDKAILKIITCHGTYVPAMKTYDHRLVVTAVLAN